jgi:hypothetical protein
MNIEDIRNADRPSGFDHVHSPKPNRWRAQAGTRPKFAGDTSGSSWMGPYRLSAEEAAQDYVNMVNLGAASPGGGKRIRTAIRRAGHSRRRTLSPAERVAADIRRDAVAGPDHPGWVYLVAERGHTALDDFVKVGWTGHERAEARLADFQVGNPRPLVMVAKFVGTKDDEANLHDEFHHTRVIGEWFRCTPALLRHFDRQEA